MIPSRLTTDPHLRRALVLWAVLAAAVCLKITVLGGQRMVYQVFAASSRHWWADLPLYANYGPTEGIDGYRYSPAFAVALTPLAYLPDRIGAIIWTLASIAILVYALHVLARDVLPGDWSPWRQRVFLTLVLAGSAVGIWSGQSNTLVLALIALGLAAIVRQRWWTASFLLAVPALIKLWPATIALLLIACWPRRLAARLAVVCAALVLLPFLTRPPSVVAWQYHQWYLSLTGPLQGRGDGYRDAWTIWEQVCTLVGRHADWGDPVGRRVYLAVQLTTVLGVLGWCLWQLKKDSCRHLLTSIFSIWAAWQLLFGPGTEQLTYGIIAPAASWAVLTSFAEKRARWLTVTAWAILAFMPAGDVEKVVLSVFPYGMILPPVGVILFVAWLVWHELKSPLPLGEG